MQSAGMGMPLTYVSYLRDMWKERLFGRFFFALWGLYGALLMLRDGLGDESSLPVIQQLRLCFPLFPLDGGWQSRCCFSWHGASRRRSEF